MNYIFMSPHFPSIYENFAVALREKGINVLGIADEVYENLSDTLRNNLTEYYKVNNMENYDDVLRACGYFTHKYGKIDRVESHNEHWLEQDAKIRTDFNVFGYKNVDLESIKRKSGMKEVVRSADIPVARGRVFHDYQDAITLVDELGYPVCVKPDIGVGASDTYKIRNIDELNRFFDIRNHEVDYIMEEFVEGDIVTYDGLVDKYGNVVFDSMLKYDKPVIEITSNNSDMYYYVPRVVEEDVRELGKRVVTAFNVKERFFHIEFFRLKKDDSIMALELNCRLPGGNTPEMWNYANDFDIYREYANVVSNEGFKAEMTRPYNCCYVSRKNIRNYQYSISDIYARHGEAVVSVDSIPGVFAEVMGDVGITIRTPDIDYMFEIIEDIVKTH